MIKYSSIDQFRNVIKSVAEYCKYKYGKRDENGDIILSQIKTWTLPTLTFKGSVKLHGSNASVRITQDEVLFQSRNRTLEIENDNAGFALWASQHKDAWRTMAEDMAEYGPEYDYEEVVIFGEWCGGNIQKGVALSQLEKMFVIFEIWLVNGGVTNYVKLDELRLNAEIPNVYSIFDFTNYSLVIDFENPQLSQNSLIDITMAVEKECPVGKAFGVSGVGEGVVWHCDVSPTARLRFKVKGEEHSASKVKTLASVDVEKIAAVSEFADMVLTESRLEQGIQYLIEQGLELTEKSTGNFVKWVSGDVFKEETDTIVENQLDPKMVGKTVSTTARKWYFERIFGEVKEAAE